MNKVPVNIRLSEELRDTARECAKKHNMTFTEFVEKALEVFISGVESQNGLYEIKDFSDIISLLNSTVRETKELQGVFVSLEARLQKRDREVVLLREKIYDLEQKNKHNEQFMNELKKILDK